MKNAFWALGLVVLSAGCGGRGGDGLPRVAAWGRLTAAGQPLPGTEILLAPEDNTSGPGALGFAGEDGVFKLADARGDRRGVVPGEYRVGLHRVLTKDGAPLREAPKPHEMAGMVEALPFRLSNPAQSSLKLVIPPSGGEVNLDIPAEMLTGK